MIRYLFKGRGIYLLCGLSAVFLIITALVMEHVYYLDPCPLCLVQRGIFALLSVLFFIRCFYGGRILSLMLVLFSMLGLIVAGRHVWLQHMPKGDLPGCIPSLGYIVDTLPFVDAIMRIMEGSADCGEVKWSFIGMSIPEWTLVIFLGYLLVGSCGFLVKDLGRFEVAGVIRGNY